MRLRLEVLNVLARLPGGRATLDEVTREAGSFTPSEHQVEQLTRFPEISEIDIFASGLVSWDNDFLQITDAGRALLLSLDGAIPPLTLPSLRTIDDPVETDERPRIFDFQHDTSDPTPARTARSLGAAALAFLSFIALMACAAAVVALVEMRSLKTEIAMLDREIRPLRDRLAKLELAEKTATVPEQHGGSPATPAADQTTAGIEPRADPTILDLSSEEIQLIREFIKPAPFKGTPVGSVHVGDPISGGTIPLPSPLTDKLPKLLGARFATRNGAIVIVRRDSHQADAVLGPN